MHDLQPEIFKLGNRKSSLFGLHSPLRNHPRRQGVSSVELPPEQPPEKRPRHKQLCLLGYCCCRPNLHPLRNGVNGLLRALPGVRDLLVTVACRRLSTSPGVQLAPAFRSSCALAGSTFTNFGKQRALAKSIFPVPLSI